MVLGPLFRWKPISRRLFCIRGCRASRCGCSPVITRLTGSNLLSVKNYGEFEFWLALCKVIAILAFIVLGAVAITGFYPYAEVSGISRLWDHGGFMPNGFGAVLSAMLITMFSLMGAEIVTIAAAESDTPDKHIVRATNS